MPIELDTLLFWCGLGLLSVGLFVFLTGKKASTEGKKESNRFEAFGIKIDVNNPSLILIMLGVVMMLAPKFLPQEVNQTSQAGEEKTVKVAEAPASVSEPPQLPLSQSVSESGPDTELMPPMSSEPVSSEAPVLVEAVREADKQQPAPAQLPTAPARSLAVPPPVAKSSPAPIPTPPKKRPAPAPVPTPAPVVSAEIAEPLPAEPAPPPLLVVAVAADADERAGIDTSAEAFAQKAAGLIVLKVQDIFRTRYEIVSRTAEDLREQLDEETKDYAALCSRFQAQALVLGDLKISKTWSTIDSAYWPNYHIHLHHCGNERSRQEVYKHLNPSNRDSFPFEQEIQNKTMKFLSDSRWVVEG